MQIDQEERLVDRLVTYTIEYRGRIVIIENVPAQVDPETGEEFFSPATVERLQAIVWSGRESGHEEREAVFQFAA
jgi:YgiT-type zinc finger domain-containing protein